MTLPKETLLSYAPVAFSVDYQAKGGWQVPPLHFVERGPGGEVPCTLPCRCLFRRQLEYIVLFFEFLAELARIQPVVVPACVHQFAV